MTFRYLLVYSLNLKKKFFFLKVVLWRYLDPITVARGLDLPGMSPANEGHPVWLLVSRLKEHKILRGEKKQVLTKDGGLQDTDLYRLTRESFL